MTISIQISASQVRTWGLRWGRSVQVPGPFSFPTHPRAHLQSHQRCPSSSQQPRAKLSWHEIPTESYFTTTELKSKELKSHARTPLKSSSVTSEQRGSCTSALPWLWQSCQMPSRRSHCHETFHHLDHFYFIGAILDLPQNETAAQSEINWAVTNSVCAPTSKDSGHSSGLSMLRSVRLSIGLCFPPESRWNICSTKNKGTETLSETLPPRTFVLWVMEHTPVTRSQPQPQHPACSLERRKSHSIFVSPLLSAPGMEDFLPESEPVENDTVA